MYGRLSYCVYLGVCLAGVLALAEEAPPKADAAKTDAAAGAEKKEAAAPAAGAEKKESHAAPAADDKQAATGSALRPVYPLKSEWFQHVVDEYEDAQEGMQLEIHAVEDILTALQASTDDYLQQSVTPEMNFRKLMKTSAEYRGHVVQVRGLLELNERFPVPDNRSGVQVVYRGQITNITGEMYTFFSIQKPPDELFKRPVRLTGIFLKRYAFKNRLAGEKLTWTPAIFVRGLEAYSEADAPPTHDPTSRTTAILAAVFLAFIVFRVVIGYVRMKNRTARENPFRQAQQRARGILKAGLKPPSVGDK